MINVWEMATFVQCYALERSDSYTIMIDFLLQPWNEASKVVSPLACFT